MSQLTRQDSVIVAPGIGAQMLYYIPYLVRIEPLNSARYRVFFNGGDIEIDLRRTESILIYGASGEVPVSFLDAANHHRVPITFHRTHQAEPFLLATAVTAGRSDLLTQQILHREDGRLRMYLARQFSVARIESLGWIAPISGATKQAARGARTLAALRNIEAEQAARYWDSYFAAAGFPGLSRRGVSPLSTALDAAAMLVRGILLRWTLHHRLSPAHGYLHEPTGYPSLVFDLIEPYRFLIEMAVMSAAKDKGVDLTPADAIHHMKLALTQTVYVPATRQWVPAKSLLHGIVLALRAYLSGDMLRFVIPVPGPFKSGRPFQTTYKLPAERREPDVKAVLVTPRILEEQ